MYIRCHHIIDHTPVFLLCFLHTEFFLRPEFCLQPYLGTLHIHFPDEIIPGMVSGTLVKYLMYHFICFHISSSFPDAAQNLPFHVDSLNPISYILSQSCRFCVIFPSYFTKNLKTNCQARINIVL